MPTTAVVTITIHANLAANGARWADKIATTVRTTHGEHLPLDIAVQHPDGIARCEVLADGGAQCTKRAGHRTPPSDDPHVFPSTVPEAG